MGGRAWTDGTRPGPTAAPEDVGRRIAATDGVRRLMAAVVEDAIECYQKFALPRTLRQHRLFQEAEEWLLSRKTDAPISFQQACENLGIEGDRIRARLRGWRDQLLTAAGVDAIPTDFTAPKQQQRPAQGYVAHRACEFEGNGIAADLEGGPGSTSGGRPTTQAAKILAMRAHVLRRAEALGNVSAACREAGISRTFFYRWRRRLTAMGQVGELPESGQR